jgi:hypothetical protein
MIPTSSCYKWLVQFGGKKVTLIFFRVVLSLACAAHWSMKNKIFCFVPVWQSNCTGNYSKAAKVIHEFEIAVYLVGSSFTFLKQWGLLYLPVTS